MSPCGNVDPERGLPLGAWLLVPLLAVLTGCASLPPLPAGFQPLAGDARVWYEESGEAYAREVSGLLDDAMEQVESVHGLPFLRPPRVLACISTPCFKRIIATPGYTAVTLPGDVLALSHKLELEENHRLQGILAHELSHLHLGQRLGHYSPSLPVWFHEGLASLAAEGGGAEYSSDQEVCDAWDAGRHVDFSRLDSPEKRHQAADFKITIHQFYRQSWRFLQYLRRRDADAFDALLAALQSGTDLVIAIADTYSSNLERLSQEFEFDAR